MTSGKTSGLGDNFYVGGFDLSGDVNSISKISSPLATLDFTTIKYSANVRQGGLRAGEIDFVTFMDNASAVSTPGVPSTTVAYVSTYANPVVVTVSGGTVTNVKVNGVTVGSGDGSYLLPAFGSITLTYTGSPTWTWTKVGGSHNALSPLPRTDSLITYARGTTAGNAAACLWGQQLNYDGTRGTDGSFTLAVTGQSDSYGLEWGTQLTAGLRVDTGATTGAAYDTGGATAFGAQAYLQMTSFAGTDCTVTIEHCTTSGGTYSSILPFAQTTAGNTFQRVSVSNTTTVDEFLKVVTTTSGGFTYAAFSVVIVKNPVAGVVF